MFILRTTTTTTVVQRPQVEDNQQRWPERATADLQPRYMVYI